MRTVQQHKCTMNEMQVSERHMAAAAMADVHLACKAQSRVGTGTHRDTTHYTFRCNQQVYWSDRLRLSWTMAKPQLLVA